MCSLCMELLFHIGRVDFAVSIVQLTRIRGSSKRLQKPPLMLICEKKFFASFGIHCVPELHAIRYPSVRAGGDFWASAPHQNLALICMQRTKI